MPLNTLQHTGHSLTTKNDLAQNVNGREVVSPSEPGQWNPRVGWVSGLRDWFW